MYDLIRPSFSTLVQLELYPISKPFDLRPLIPVGQTLREFIYKVDEFDPNVLDVIPEVFPHLTGLILVIQKSTEESRWKVFNSFFFLVGNLK